MDKEAKGLLSDLKGVIDSALGKWFIAGIIIGCIMGMVVLTVCIGRQEKSAYQRLNRPGDDWDVASKCLFVMAKAYGDAPYYKENEDEEGKKTVMERSKFFLECIDDYPGSQDELYEYKYHECIGKLEHKKYANERLKYACMRYCEGEGEDEFCKTSCE